MDSKIMNVRAKPFSLKDYLLDDTSSCSSNGFRSFPRRQCCTTTVRYLLDIELKKSQQPQQYSHLKKSPSKSALSAFQYIIAAVKRLPFPAGRSSEGEKKQKKSILPRSISKKIIKKSTTFWRRKTDDEEIGRLKSFDEMMGENDVVEVPLEDKKVGNCETMGVPQSDVWGGSTSTTGSDGSSGGITSSSSTSSTKEKPWSTEEKEQLSPVSVLDCPFDDEDDEVSSPFQHRLAHIEETKNKLKKKIHRFESLAELEPLNLTARFALQPESDNESPEWPQQCPYESNSGKITSEIEQKEDEHENYKKALVLLHQLKHKHP